MVCGTILRRFVDEAAAPDPRGRSERAAVSAAGDASEAEFRGVAAGLEEAASGARGEIERWKKKAVSSPK